MIGVRRLEWQQPVSYRETWLPLSKELDGRAHLTLGASPAIRFGQYTAPLVAVSAGSSPLISSGTESRSSQLGLLAGEAVFFAVR